MINILFCGNEAVFDGMLTCTLSILKRSLLDEPFTFYVFTMDVSHIKDTYVPISHTHMDFFNSVIKKYSPKSNAILIDVTDIYMGEFSCCPNENAYCSPYTLIRLFADLVKGMPDKILYLDADVLFNRDIILLYKTSVDGYEYAAACDHYGKYLVKSDYINAGVLLLNLKEIKKTGLFQKARALIKAKKLPFADQSAIIRSTTKKKLLSQKFNEQRFLKKSTVIRHFSKRLFWLPYPHTGNIKQWHVSDVHRVLKYYEFDDILFEYIYLKNKFDNEVLKNEH